MKKTIFFLFLAVLTIGMVSAQEVQRVSPQHQQSHTNNMVSFNHAISNNMGIRSMPITPVQVIYEYSSKGHLDMIKRRNRAKTTTIIGFGTFFAGLIIGSVTNDSTVAGIAYTASGIGFLTGTGSGLVWLVRNGKVRKYERLKIEQDILEEEIEKKLNENN